MSIIFITSGSIGGAFWLGPAPTVINGAGNLFLSAVQVTNENLTINSTNPSGAFNAAARRSGQTNYGFVTP